MPPFYVTTPIYYVNDVPHLGHAYATVTADALARWHRLAGDEVFFLTGTDEHGDKIARAAEANGVSPQEWVDRTSARFVEAWATLNISNDDFIRTTEPRHHRAVQHFLQTIHDNGYTELGVYAGLYCVYCEDYKKESDLIDGNCAIHLRPVELLEEENYFFKLERLRRPAAAVVRGPSRRHPPERQAQRGPGDHQGGPGGHLHHPDVDPVGGGGPLGHAPRLLRLVRRAHQLPDGHRLRRGPGPFRHLVAGRPPSAREGHHPLPLRLVAGHVHGRRHRAAGAVLVTGWLLVRARRCRSRAATR